MLLKSIYMQSIDLLRRKSVIITFFILFGFVTFNFCQNLLVMNGKDICQIFDLFKIITLGDYSTSGFILMQFYPLLVVFPTACTYLDDKNSGAGTYIQARTGCREYYYGKIISIILITFLLFSVPFLAELFLNMVCFPNLATGDPSNFEYHVFIESENQYVASEIYLKNKAVYVAAMTLLFAVVSGILAGFNASVTFLPFFKYKLFALFPIYVIVFFLVFIEQNINLDFSVNYSLIFRIYNITPKNLNVYILFFVILVSLTIGLIEYKIRKGNLT